MDHAQGFNSLQDQIQKALISVTRTAGQISSEDLSFQRSLNPSIGPTIDEQSGRLLALSSSLLKSAASISELEAPNFQEVEDVDISWRAVVDIVDSLLEKADTCLDEYTGVIKRKTPPTTEQSPSKLRKHPGIGNWFRTQNLMKPQLGFLNKPDNTTVTPWKPILTSKPHATIPIAQSLGTFTDELQHLQYKHPYEIEILELKYPDAVYRRADPIPSQDIETSRAIFIDTFEGVLAMLADLKGAKEIAVDLEHHDARSYVGLVSLMQISTRQKNWIIDTLKPWRQDLQILNEVFADPKIIKVFHGAYMDIVWLQRDLGLYVVGLFDTHHASRVLGYPGGSLAYLLKRFVNFDADKKYQMADWRIRPLPEEMFFYAMTDTHFLLYIFDNMRNQLVERPNPGNLEGNSIELVLQKSKETSLLRFERQIYEERTGLGPAGWYNLLVKTPALFNNQQFAVFRAIHAWRDRIARIDDDSINYVMSNKIVFNIAKLMPTDMVSLYGAAHPISHNVKSREAELLALIKSAKESEEDGPNITDVLRPDPVGATVKTASSLSAALGQIENERSGAQDPSTVSLRSTQSVFWGGAFGSSVWNTHSTSVRNEIALNLAIPMPLVASEVITDLIDGSTGRSHFQDRYLARHEEQQSQPSLDEEAFTIKRGRKANAKTTNIDPASLGDPPKEYDISLNHDEGMRAGEKTSKKAERKAQKKLEKAAQKFGNGDGTKFTGEGGDDEPFDYNNADSVLHGKRKDTVDGSKTEKPFDPYSKSSNAPKGIRKLQTERPGKSFTFTS